MHNIAEILGWGYQTRISEHFDISYQAVNQWFRAGRVPDDRIIGLCALVDFKVTPHQFSASRYPHPKDGLPVEMRGAA